MRKVTLIALVGTAGALAFACSSQTFSSSSGDGGTNTGGSDTGGSSSAGGASGSAGSLQMGGVSSTGGARATGGASGTAGSLGSGGHATGGAGAGGRASGGTGGGSTGGASGGGGIGTSCRADGDCSHQNSLYCAAPGAFVGCGNCPSPGLIPSCTTDAECNPDSGGTSICVGACDGACPLKQCEAGCVDDTPCAEGTHCGTSHRCEALSCSTVAECPPNFDCAGAQCSRRRCTADTACDGYCVTGYCYSALGHCDEPRA